MRGIFSPDGKGYAFLAKLSNIAILNFWWVIASLPIVTFGASTTAMFSAAYKLAKGEEITVTHDFWQAFKANWKQSTIIWLILAALAVILGADTWFWYKQNQAGAGTVASVMLVVSLCLMLVWLLETIYVFAMQAHYENTWQNMMRNSLLYAYRNPGASFMLLVLAATAVVLNLTILFVNILFVIYGFGWFGYMAARIHLGTFARQEERYEKSRKQNKEENTDTVSVDK